MPIKYKHKKTCFTLLTMMERDHDIKPGTIFRLKEKQWFPSCAGDIDEDKVIVSKPQRGYMIQRGIAAGEILMFVDVVYDPHIRKHFFRFLHGDKMVGVQHQKGKSLKLLREIMERVDLTSEEEGDA